MKKLQLLIALATISFSSVQAMNHDIMCAKRDALQQKCVDTYRNSVKGSGIPADVIYTEDDKRFYLPKCLWEIQNNQSENHPHMDLTLKSIETDSQTGRRIITITVANTK